MIRSSDILSKGVLVTTLGLAKGIASSMTSVAPSMSVVGGATTGQANIDLDAASFRPVWLHVVVQIGKLHKCRPCHRT